MTWYTKNTWTKEDEEEFYIRLKRSREYNRPQYLKTQAFALIETKKSKLLDVAESLINQLLKEYPNDIFNKSSALNFLGDIYQQRGDYHTALKHYRESINFENVNPNSPQTSSFLSYSELIIKTQQTDKYPNVENLLFDRMDSVILPVQKYKIASILSVIYQTNNNQELAQHYAEIAEKNATAETSGFRYHKDVGVVKQRLNWLDKLVKRK
ncbi:hypothetical protein [Salinimicrobium gaetbulicola]|uniref:Tetratricopeptide repeat protein n=1 Tax=Salinimicrobium gaetbulicola TaxID=999702 RepID=A0ABW3IB80_9FLAO